MATKGKNINILMVFRILGQLLIIESAFMLIPLITSIVYKESDYIAFVWSVVITLTAGVAMAYGIRPKNHNMAKREGFLLTSLVWIIFSIFGMIPFLLSEHPFSVSDAFFEAMSGFSTTGASSVGSAEALSRGELMWRCVMQWIGGMGIILFTLAIFPMLNHSGGMQMFNAEVTGITHDKIRPRINQTAKGYWGIYIALTALLVILLWLGPMDLFESLCNAFSTISTGGFGTTDGNIGSYNSVYIKIVLTVFMFLGGTSFALMYKAMLGDRRALLKNEVFRTYLQFICLFYCIFVVTIVVRGEARSISSVTIDPLFQIISTITSTGISVVNYEEWGGFLLSILFVLMFCGSCAGSTSGGAKIDRILFLIKNTRNEVYRSIHPNEVLNVRINDKVMPSTQVSRVIAFLSIFIMLIFGGGIILTAIGLPMVDAFFSSFSCICNNTGLGAGVTGYGQGFETIPDAGKWVLSALMLIGRLELFTILVLFTKSFWRR